ncbi:MAG: hypothetical protein J5971_04230 [Prevotella sp.]|nr:hypothetical protein [Prevotella sp.]
MDRETYESQKPFAGEKVPSMNRRMVGHDYQARQMYMVTMVTEGRRPLLATVQGKSDGAAGTPDAPRAVPTELGARVEQCWREISVRYPQIALLGFQLMPDHFHGILFVKEHIEKPMGKVLLGFKQGCNKAFRELVLGKLAGPSVPASPSVPAVPAGPSVPAVAAGPSGLAVPSVAVIQQQTKRGASDRRHGLLFAPGFNDKLLLRAGQLDVWRRYLADNPRRLLMKREHPDLFRVQRGLVVGGQSFSAIGNRFLLERPVRLQVQCSRRLTQAEIEGVVQHFLAAAAQGAVLVSPSISPGEKAVMRAAFNQGFPLIYLQENGFTDLAKPGGQRMEACARGQLLILAPWEHHNERMVIRRDQCLSLNNMAQMICSFH